MARLRSPRGASPTPAAPADQFHGFDELIELLRLLYRSRSDREPRFGTRLAARMRSPVGARGPDRTPPIICCVQNPVTADPDLLDTIRRRLGEPADRLSVPHVAHVLPADSPGPTAARPAASDAAVVRSVLAVLIALAGRLESRSAGATGGSCASRTWPPASTAASSASRSG